MTLAGTDGKEQSNIQGSNSVSTDDEEEDNDKGVHKLIDSDQDHYVVSTNDGDVTDVSKYFITLMTVLVIEAYPAPSAFSYWDDSRGTTDLLEAEGLCRRCLSLR